MPYAFLLAFSQNLLCHLVQHAFNLSSIYSDYTYRVAGFQVVAVQTKKKTDLD
jgi:hypothetical protein